MSDYLAAYCPPAAALVLITFLFTLLVHPGRRTGTTDAPEPKGKKRRF